MRERGRRESEGKREIQEKRVERGREGGKGE